jgi:hypothetical protein
MRWTQGRTRTPSSERCVARSFEVIETEHGKQQLYNWFKNTVGRHRRKIEGKPRSTKKAAEKGGTIVRVQVVG